jgi:RNase P/RNase MRP subunit p29
VNKKQIKDLALSNGFKLKEQPSGEMDLNPYVYDFADALLAKANEREKRLEKILQRYESEQLQPLKLRVKELEQELFHHKEVNKNLHLKNTGIATLVSELTGNNVVLPKMKSRVEIKKALNKFTLEQKIEGMQRVLDCRELNLSQGEIDTIKLMQEQLRKEQE